MGNKINKFHDIKEVLQALIDQDATIILVSGQRLNVEVEAVVDNLLVASIGNRILFIDIECICVVVTCCEEILEFLLQKNKFHEKLREEPCKKSADGLFMDEEV